MKRRGRRESGFALLLVFLMAAVLAISLYIEIPRVAFETQRQKEQLLVERGEQYKRALQVFTRTFSRYPAKIEDLENTNNRHFLRRRYLDPITGKDEWRVIHMQNGVLTDSKVQKQQQQQQKDTTTAIGQTVGQVAGLGLNNTLPNQAAMANPANRRRDSDTLAPGTGAATGDPNNPGGGTIPTGQPGGIPGMPGTPGFAPGMPGVPGMPPGLPQPGQVYPTPAGNTGVPGVPGMGGTGGTSAGGSGSGYVGGGGSYLGGGGSYLGGSGSNTGGVAQAGYPPGIPVNSQTGGVSPSPYSTQGGAANSVPGFQQPGVTTPGFQPPGFQQAGPAPSGLQQPGMPAGQNLAGMLGLTGPRPGGMPTSNTNGMSTMGGGIAGFASKADQDSIMVYNDQKNYGLWEFVFDPTKVPPLPNPLTGTPGTQAGNRIGTPATQVGTPVGQMPGATTSFGSPGGTGSAPAMPSSLPGGFGLPAPNPQPPPPE